MQETRELGGVTHLMEYKTTAESRELDEVTIDVTNDGQQTQQKPQSVDNSILARTDSWRPTKFEENDDGYNTESSSSSGGIVSQAQITDIGSYQRSPTELTTTADCPSEYADTIDATASLRTPLQRSATELARHSVAISMTSSAHSTPIPGLQLLSSNFGEPDGNQI